MTSENTTSDNTRPAAVPTEAADTATDLPTFRKLLVALDRTNPDLLVFKRALALAKAQNSQLLLFHGLSVPAARPNVLVTGSMGVYGGAYATEMLQQSQEWMAEERRQVISWLRGLCDQAIAEGVAAEFDFRSGEPSHQVCELAATWGADLVVVGRRGRAGLSEMVLGSVSNYVVHHAPCAVMVVQ